MYDLEKLVIKFYESISHVEIHSMPKSAQDVWWQGKNLLARNEKIMLERLSKYGE